MRNLLSLLLFGSLLSFSSCISNQSLVYFQNFGNSPELVDENLIGYEFAEYKLQYNDILSIDIKTSVAFVNEAFNVLDGSSNAMRGGMGMQGGGDVYYMTGYKVDRMGDIELPLLGKIHVSGFTIEQAKEMIQNALEKIVNEEVFVRVKLGGIRYAIFGEVNRPGKFTILQDRVTIFEALANAGDFTSFAKRNQIVLLRQYPEGTKIHKINLLDRNIIQTPFYFIQNNDQIYAEPLKQREFARTENASQNVLLISSVLTTLLLIFGLVR